MADRIEINYREGEDDSPEPDNVEGTENRASISTDTDVEKPEGGDDDRPEWLPEKFKSPEDMAKAYSELQKRMSKGEPADDLDLSDEDSGDDDEGSTDDDLSLDKKVEKAADKADIDLDAIAAEYVENNELSAETYEQLEEAGFSRENANRYIRGLKAEADSMRSRVAEVVGGEDALPEVLGWARDNLTEGEKALYEDARSKGDEDGLAMAMRGIYAKYVEANGEAPNLLKDTPTGRRKGSVEPFASMDEYVDAIRDPRYRKEAAYRRKVDRRLEASDI